MDKYKIYPKQFRNARIPIEKNRIFFIMPFSDDFDIVYGGIKSLLNKEDYICTRVDEVNGSTPIINKILTEILKAQFIIADLTGCNPNVFYELGVAHTFKDAQNIILLKQKDSKVPFDITHLTYMEYEKNNLKYLVAQIKQTLNENKYISDFLEILNIKGIIEFVHDNQDEFIDALKALLDEDITIVTEIMREERKIEPEVLHEVLSRFENTLKSYTKTSHYSMLKGIFDFYSELLLSCDYYTDTPYYVNSFLIDFFVQTNLNDREIMSFQIDFVIKFALSKKQLNVVMPWIVSYFRQSKFSNVDLNRYKLESFLLSTNDREINEIITATITDKDCHIREHFADIIGEKKLYSSNGILCKQLVSETNYFTAASMMEALGKLGMAESISYIKMWLKEHGNSIVETKSFFVLKHARNAIVKLDRNYLNDFDTQYIQYLGEFIL